MARQTTRWNEVKDLSRHVDTHNLPLMAHEVLPLVVGTRSATFTQPLWMPIEEGYTVLGVVLMVSSTIAQNPAAYWDIQVQQMKDGRGVQLATFSTSTQRIVANTPRIIEDIAIPVTKRLGIVVTGTKVGAAANLADLMVQFILTRT